MFIALHISEFHFHSSDSKCNRICLYIWYSQNVCHQVDQAQWIELKLKYKLNQDSAMSEWNIIHKILRLYIKHSPLFLFFMI